VCEASLKGNTIKEKKKYCVANSFFFNKKLAEFKGVF
jgi:hypothetical protein